LKILLTGFEPFGTVRVNPSEQIVRKISAAAPSRDKQHLFLEVLPAEYRLAEKKIRRLIRTIRPEAVVCLGVAAARDAICLERVALNLDDGEFADNAGQVRSGRMIVRGGPVAYWSTLPLGRMQKALKRRGIRATLSNHAGTYVCNHVFYAARHEIERTRNHARCGLIHVPGLRKRGKDSKPRGMALGRMVAAVECCLRVLRKQDS
jgi:pyroglutamyl-peptidase